MHETVDRDILQVAEPSRVSHTIHPRLGIIGGGQLAKMTALAGLQLGCDVVVLERNNFSPAANLATHSIVGDWDDPEALLKLASQVDVVTLENEFVDAGSLAVLKGFRLWPSAKTIGLVQDKLFQKQAVAGAGLPVPRFEAVATREAVVRAGEQFGWPLLLKARRNAYDGKGNVTLGSAAEVDAGWQRLGGDKGRGLFAEEFCRFKAELAVMVTRSARGEMVTYPVVETVQRNHVCHLVKAPAEIDPGLAERVIRIAQQAVVSLEGVGSFGVELFLTVDNQVVVNEMAPRVHNSGHYTIEACACSQFENHVRAVLGWPLGSTRMVAPAAAMVNLLGAEKAVGRPLGMESALQVEGAHVHIYGKAMANAGRKMGHVTALGTTVEEAVQIAQRAANAIRFGNPG